MNEQRNFLSFKAAAHGRPVLNISDRSLVQIVSAAYVPDARSSGLHVQKAGAQTAMSRAGNPYQLGLWRRVVIAALLLLIGLTLASVGASAQTFDFRPATEPYVDSMSLRHVVATSGPDTITVRQSQYGNMSNATTSNNGFTVKSLIASALFKVNVASLDIGQKQRFTYLIAYQTLGIADPNSGTPSLSAVDTLSVSYDRDSLSIINDKSFRVAGPYHELKVIVSSVTEITQTTSGPVYTTLLPADSPSVPTFVHVYSEIRLQKFFGSVPETVTVSQVAVINNIAATGTIDLDWTTSTAASKRPAGYEIEWTYVSPDSPYVPAASAALPYTFRHNATRVFTNNTSFKIPVARKEGHLVWRIRQVRPQITNLTARVYGNWSGAPESGLLNSSSVPSNCRIDIVKSANDRLNWDLKMSFVEDGKYKQVMTYYDGLLKQKQVQTRFHSDPQRTIVAQSLYDHEGRAVITTLPIPVYGIQNFGHLRNFLHPAGDTAYSKLDYDALPDTSACPPNEKPIDPLADNALANKYYSRFNPVTSGHHAFIPDAEGYPMTRKIFAAENPEKVLFEGGAGRALQLGYDRQTAYLYGSPIQAELNRYFGQDIGKANYYRKTVTTDQHGQDAFSITDDAGKPVMTGMVGSVDTNVLAFSVCNAPVNDSFKSNLLPNPDIRFGEDWHANGSHFVELQANYGFRYSINYAPFKPCTNVAKRLLPKVYFEYEVRDYCGNLKASDTGALGGVGLTEQPLLTYFKDDGALLEKGNHSWIKHSYIKLEDIAASVDSFLNLPVGCFLTFNDFLKEEFLAADFPCPAPNPCEAMAYSMMREMYPSARYGKYHYTDSATKAFVSGAPSSIFEQVSVGSYYRYQAECINFPDTVVHKGVKYYNLQQLPQQTFIDIFNDSMAWALLPLHPDYCKLAQCPLLTHPYAQRLTGIEKASEAIALDRYELADIAAADTLVIAGLFTAAQLSHTVADSLPIDSLAFKNTICGSEAAAVREACEAVNATKGPADIVDYPTYVRDEYYRNLVKTYASNREQRLSEWLRSLRDAQCPPCQTYAIEPVDEDTSWSASDSAFLAGGLDTMTAAMDTASVAVGGTANATPLGGILQPGSGFTLATLNDVSATDDSLACAGRVGAIMASLENCTATTSVMTALRDTLTRRFCGADCNPGLLTPDSLDAILTSLNIPVDDLCNAGLADLWRFGGRSADAVSPGLLDHSPAYYTDAADFLNVAGVFSFIASSGTTGSTSVNVHRCDSYPFEQDLARRLGLAPNSSCNPVSVTMEKAIATADDPVRLRFSYGSTHIDYHFYPFSASDTNALHSSLIAAPITSATALKVRNLFNLYGFDPVSHSLANRNTFLVGFEGTRAGVAGRFVYCMSAFDATTDYHAAERDAEEMVQGVAPAELLPMVRATLTKAGALGIRAGHPLFRRFFANTTNWAGRIHFSADNYEEAIRTGGITDSLVIPKHSAHFAVRLPSAASIPSFMNAVRNQDTVDAVLVHAWEEAGGWTQLMIELSAGSMKTVRAAKASITARAQNLSGHVRYLPALVGDTVAQLLSTGWGPVPAGGLGAAFPAANFPGVTITSAPVTARYFIPGYGPFSAPAGSSLITVQKTSTTAYDTSHFLDTLYRYLEVAAPLTGVMASVESAVSRQYDDARVEAWRSYAHTLPADDHNRAAKGSKPAAIAAAVPTLASQAMSYANAMRPGYRNDLYIDGAATTDPVFGQLSSLLTALQAHNLSTYAQNTLLRPTTSALTNLLPQPPGSPNTETRAYVCGDSSVFWINHFDASRRMINLFIQLPPHLPMPRTAYKLLQAKKGFEKDSVSYMTLTLAASGAGGLTDTIHCTAHANLKMGGSYVIPSAFLSSHSNADVNLEFHNCETAKIETLYPTAAVRYALYRDSVRSGLIVAFRDHIIDSVRERLDIRGLDIKHGLTLYSYDVAGNLIRTVSPAGVASLPVGVTGVNDTIDAHRRRDERGAPMLPTHGKITRYRYNAANKVVWTSTPDGGVTHTWHDRLGRPVLSQTARQAQMLPAPGEMTYFLYDRLGRVVETGGVTMAASSIPALNPITTLGSSFANTIIGQQRREVVVTLYDTASFKTVGPFATQAAQENLKHRVSCVKYFDVVSNGADASKDTAYAHALHYSYDLSGNVKTLVHDLRTLMRPELRMKRVDYEYDLHSGKVLLAAYNRGRADQFYQKYTYDEDNRITEAQSSGNGILWDRDAQYDYYAHGPLARTSLGEQRVQGVDYAYTINGWLKATNGTQRDHGHDMGADGIANGVTPVDVFSQRIHYFDRDYRAIGDSTFFDHLPAVNKSLYNGNIAAIGTALAPFANLQSAYHYDPLQRIERARYTDYEYPSNLAQPPLSDWANDYTYDKDGNLLKLKRRGGTVPGPLNGGTPIADQTMDSLTYRYAAGTNRLRNLQDSATATAYGIDIPHTAGDTSVLHYEYDASGNMTKDAISGLSLIEWNRQGKVKGISKTDGTRITFAYDALGNRLAKEVVLYPAADSMVKLKTVYLRDASGNSLAVYEDKKEYDLEQLTLTAVSGDPTLGTGGPGKLPASWTNAVAEELVGAFNIDPSKDLAKMALSIPALASYASKASLMQDLASSLSGAEALGLTKSVPAITNYALDGNAGEDGGSVEITAEKLALYLEPILLSRNTGAQQTDLLAAIKDNDHGLWDATVATIPATNQQKSDFPDDGGAVVEALQDMRASDKAALNAELATALAGTYHSMLDVLRPVLVAAYSPANTYADFVSDVPNSDFIYEQLRSDAQAYIGFRYGQASNDIIPIDTAAAPYKTNPVLAAKLSAPVSGSPSAAALSEVVGGHLDGLLDLAQNSGQGPVLVAAFKKVIGGILIEPAINQWLDTKQIQRVDRMHLAEHHLYGSSRLGMQKYLPSALVYDAFAATAPSTYQSLIQPKPWYSRYGGDLFSFSVYKSDTLGTAQMSTAGLGTTAHILGQRHYELTNHLGNVQATVLDRTTPILDDGMLLGYKADISAAQDYYPFGMLMPGRYISDTARHCVTQTMLVRVQKPIEAWVEQAHNPVALYRYGGGSEVPGVGSLPVASSFEEEVLHLYHYLEESEHPNNWIAKASEAEGGHGLDYEIDLSGEPSDITSYLHLHLDTTVSSQSFDFGMELDGNREAVAEVRVRQYAAESSEEYETLVDWKQLEEGTNEISVPVSKWAVAAGGKTVAEWRFTSGGGKSFSSGALVKVKGPRVGMTQWVTENRVVKVCEERDNYRFGYNAQEKDNEVRGLGNSLNFTYRMEDVRLGRFFAVDPLATKYPWLSTYQVAGNTPIWARELEGLEPWYTTSPREYGTSEVEAPADAYGPYSSEWASQSGLSGNMTIGISGTEVKRKRISNAGGTKSESEPSFGFQIENKVTDPERGIDYLGPLGDRFTATPYVSDTRGIEGKYGTVTVQATEGKIEGFGFESGPFSTSLGVNGDMQAAVKFGPFEFSTGFSPSEGAALPGFSMILPNNKNLKVGVDGMFKPRGGTALITILAIDPATWPALIPAGQRMLQTAPAP